MRTYNIAKDLRRFRNRVGSSEMLNVPRTKRAKLNQLCTDHTEHLDVISRPPTHTHTRGGCGSPLRRFHDHLEAVARGGTAVRRHPCAIARIVGAVARPRHPPLRRQLRRRCDAPGDSAAGRRVPGHRAFRPRGSATPPQGRTGHVHACTHERERVLVRQRIQKARSPTCGSARSGQPRPLL